MRGPRLACVAAEYGLRPRKQQRLALRRSRAIPVAPRFALPRKIVRLAEAIVGPTKLKAAIRFELFA
jgi:hypothetical protein